jgi:LacI family transcriptional regulator
MAVRMKGVAQELGVSVVTVSKVLHNRHDVSDATKQRVWARMKELNYRPNLAARGLSLGRSYTVELIVPDLVHAFFSEIATGLSHILRSGGYGLILSSSDEDPALEKQRIEDMLARRVDVLLVASCQQDPEGLLGVKQQDIPLVLIDRKFRGYRDHFIGNDDQLIAEIATQHLIESWPPPDRAHCRSAGKRLARPHPRLSARPRPAPHQSSTIPLD